MAASLSVPLIGVHKLSYEVSGLDNELRVPEVSGYALRARSKAASTALDSLDLSHTTSVEHEPLIPLGAPLDYVPHIGG